MIARALLRCNTASVRQSSLIRHVGVTSSFSTSAFIGRSDSTDPKKIFSSFKGSGFHGPVATNFRLFSAEVLAPPTSNHKHTKLENAKGSLIYTETDEAPALATFSLLPSLSKVSYII